MSFHTESEIMARKQTRCEICLGRIASGTRYLKLVGKYNGEFYADRVHIDCHSLWNRVYVDWAEPCEGMRFDLAEVFVDSGDEYDVCDTLNTWRGHYPHAVCRIEFRLRHWLKGGAA